MAKPSDILSFLGAKAPLGLTLERKGERKRERDRPKSCNIHCGYLCVARDVRGVKGMSQDDLR